MEVAPSPKSQSYLVIVPSGSLLPALEKFTVTGAMPARGAELVATATGGFPVEETAEPVSVYCPMLA